MGRRGSNLRVSKKMYGMSLGFGSCYNWNVAGVLWVTAWAWLACASIAILSLFVSRLTRVFTVARSVLTTLLSITYLLGLWRIMFFIRENLFHPANHLNEALRIEELNLLLQGTFDTTCVSIISALIVTLTSCVRFGRVRAWCLSVTRSIGW